MNENLTWFFKFQHTLRLQTFLKESLGYPETVIFILNLNQTKIHKLKVKCKRYEWNFFLLLMLKKPLTALNIDLKSTN